MNLKKKRNNFKQQLLFETIAGMNINHNLLAGSIADLLEISTDAAYRRIRGEKLLAFDELIIICEHYNISIDSLLKLDRKEVIFQNQSINLNEKDKYFQLISQLLHQVETFSKSKSSEIMLSALDVPAFHIYRYKLLPLFDAYYRFSGISDNTLCFEDMVETFDMESYRTIYNSLADSYSKIISTEIWTKDSVNGILKKIDYAYESGSLKKDNALFLCYELIDLLRVVNRWSDLGKKESDKGNIPFYLYVSDIGLENNFMTIADEFKLVCSLRLYSSDSLQTTNPAFCGDAVKWLHHVVRKSTLISGSSLKESFKFFNQMTQRVNYIIDKIERSTGHSDTNMMSF